MFSINCLEILDECDEHLLKNLKIGKYFFNDRYIKVDDKLKYNDSSLMNVIPNFWEDKINIQAVVGRNGSGKSTLLDLMYMAINNFSYMFERGNERPGAEALCYVKELYVNLFFSLNIDDKECEACLSCKGDEVEIKIINSDLKIEHSRKSFSFFLRNVVRKILGRTASKCTLEAEKVIFEKRFLIDEKFCPIEEKENAQRGLHDEEIAELVKNFFYTIVSNYSMQSFIYNNYMRDVRIHQIYSKKGKQIQGDTNDSRLLCWIDSIFHKNDGYTRSIVLNPYRHYGLLDLNREMKLSKERIANLFVWSALKNDDERQIFGPYSFEAVQIKMKNEPVVNPDLDRDFVDRLYRWGARGLMPLLNKETLQSDYLTAMTDAAITIPKDCIGFEKVKHFMTNKAGVETLEIFIPEKIDEDYLTLNIIDVFQLVKYERVSFSSSLKYIRYKIIKIVFTYDAYKEYRKMLFCALVCGESEYSKKGDVVRLLEKIRDDSSHITKKIRRTVNYIILDNIREPTAILDKSYFRNKIHNLNKSPFKYNANEISLNNIDDCFPPPFFDYSLKLQKDVGDSDEKSKDIDYNLLSSGEIQLLQTLSIHAYHIANLLSVSDGRPKYDCINLVFDELEVCLHPEMQRQFIYRLVKMLTRIKNKSTHFNVMIVTHSPFVLSDIPLKQILFLEDGVPKEKRKDTFAGNIGEMMYDSFFMESTIGAFAEDKLKKLISKIYNKELSKQSEEFKQFVNCIGDSVVKNMMKEVEPKNDKNR